MKLTHKQPALDDFSRIRNAFSPVGTLTRGGRGGAALTLAYHDSGHKRGFLSSAHAMRELPDMLRVHEMTDVQYRKYCREEKS